MPGNSAARSTTSESADRPPALSRAAVLCGANTASPAAGLLASSRAVALSSLNRSLTAPTTPTTAGRSEASIGPPSDVSILLTQFNRTKPPLQINRPHAAASKTERRRRSGRRANSGPSNDEQQEQQAAAAAASASTPPAPAARCRCCGPNTNNGGGGGVHPIGIGLRGTGRCHCPVETTTVAGRARGDGGRGGRGGSADGRGTCVHTYPGRINPSTDRLTHQQSTLSTVSTKTRIDLIDCTTNQPHTGDHPGLRVGRLAVPAARGLLPPPGHPRVDRPALRAHVGPHLWRAIHPPRPRPAARHSAGRGAQGPAAPTGERRGGCVRVWSCLLSTDIYVWIHPPACCATATMTNPSVYRKYPPHTRMHTPYR